MEIYHLDFSELAKVINHIVYVYIYAYWKSIFIVILFLLHFDQFYRPIIPRTAAGYQLNYFYNSYVIHTNASKNYR